MQQVRRCVLVFATGKWVCVAYVRVDFKEMFNPMEQ
jgi:hypothetical protein